MASDPEQIAETLRELGHLDPVELGQQAVLECIARAAATCCASTGGVGLLLLDRDQQLRYVVAAGRPRRALAGSQVRLGEGPSVDAFLEDAPVASNDLAGEPRWPDFRPAGAGGGHPGVAEHTGAPAPRPHRRARLRPHRPPAVAAPATWRPPTPTPSGSWRPCGRPPPGSRSRSPRRCGSRSSTTPGSSRRVTSSCSANGSTRPLRSSCCVSRPRSRANRSEPSPNASSPAPDVRSASAQLRTRLGGRWLAS